MAAEALQVRSKLAAPASVENSGIFHDRLRILSKVWPSMPAVDPTSSRSMGLCLCREASLVFLFTPGDYPERIVTKRPLKPERFLDRRTHPQVDFLRRGENDRHGLWMNRFNHLVRLGRQKCEEIVGRLAFPHLPNGGPAGPDACEESQPTFRFATPTGGSSGAGSAGAGGSSRISRAAAISCRNSSRISSSNSLGSKAGVWSASGHGTKEVQKE
jgi:hypothetical protein